MLDKAAIEDLKARYALSALVSRVVTLKRSGRRLKGRCPFHTEKTPSFFVDDGRGTYHCYGCGAHGDIVRFVRETQNVGFVEALRIISDDNLPEVSEADRRRALEAENTERLATIVDAKEIWAKSVPASGTPAEVYIREARGIRRLRLPDTVRFVRTWAWKNYETGEVGDDLPAMVCAIQSSLGEVVGLQRIFLGMGGRSKANMRVPKLSLGAIRTGAFRIGPPADEIVLVEGPEDALTVAQEMPGRSVWCACGTGNLHQVEMPPIVRSVVLAGDNNTAGRAAVARAAEAYAQRGLAVHAVYPDPSFKDWNDQLRGVKADGVGR